jgi:membrane protein
MAPILGLTPRVTLNPNDHAKGRAIGTTFQPGKGALDMTVPESPTPTQPTATANAPPNRWRNAWSFLYELVLAVTHQPVSMLAKQAAYSLLYAIPSILIVLVSLTAIVDERTNAGASAALQEYIIERVPPELQPLLNALFDAAIAETNQSTAVLAALVSFGVAVWGGAGGAGALIYACNLVYDVRDRRSWFRRTLLKLTLMVVGGVGTVAGFILFAFGQRIGEWIAAHTARESPLVDLLDSGRGLSLVLVTGTLLLLYVLAPDIDKSIRWLLPGTFAATTVVGITFLGLDLILRFTNPGSAYGAAGSVLILLWTLYVMSAIIVVGAIVNAFVGRRFDRKLAGELGVRRGNERGAPDAPA